jgi:hypothetical protein
MSLSPADAVKAQGDVVRELKAAKAPKEQIDAAVAKLQALKAAAGPAPATAAAPAAVAAAAPAAGGEEGEAKVRAGC